MDDAIARYPADRKRSAAMPLLHLWQEEFGFISDEGVRWIAAKLELQPINILELVTFYPMFRQTPAGKTHIRICRTLSCAMAGSYQIMERTCAAAGIVRERDDNGMHAPVSVSKDGKYSIEFVECLASCGTAPVCMVQDELIENVQPENAAILLNPKSKIENPKSEGRVVGIDPGLNVTGYAVVEPSPRGAFVVEAGVIRPGSGCKALGERLTVGGHDPALDRVAARWC